VRKLVAASLALSLFAACGSDDDKTASSTTAAAATTAAPATTATTATTAGSATTAGPASSAATTEGSTAETTAETEATTAETEATTAPTESTAPAEQPKSGGSITISPGLSNLAGLDPAVGIATGCCGGTEMLLIYDSLMRYNPETAKFEPNTAESLEANDDFTEWTLKIKPDLKFSDGTPYDAEAVKFNVERHQTTPTSQEYAVLSQLLDTVTVVDPLTVSFKMKQSWSNFPVSLSAGAGMIADPKLVQAKGKDFNVDPGDAGIGPMMVESFKPGESLTLKKKPSYWNGETYLDEVKSVLVVGSDAQVQAIQTGTLQGAMVMTSDAIPGADKAGLPRINFPYLSGNLTVLNAGKLKCNGGAPAKYCTGVADGTEVETDTPTKDVRVRQAIAMATDRDAINQRIYNGTLETYDTFIPKGNRYDPGVPGIAYDPDGAKKLVEEVKAETGWDGSIRLVTGVPSQTSLNLLQLYKTMLDAVGMNASIETDKTLAQIQIDKDFDVYPAFAWGTSEDRLFEGLFGSLRNDRYGYSSPEMDAALATLGRAGTEAEKIAALKTIEEIFTKDVPAVPVGAGYRNFVYSPNLKGVQGSAFQIVDLRKAWLDQ
jgi:peptide/nickel transport system substrate-binding protein